MAASIGVVKQILGVVVAVDVNGNERVLSIGDEIFAGEVVKPRNAGSEAVLSMSNGETINITETVAPKMASNQAFGGENAMGELTALQQAILQGQTLEDLEETAAGAGDAGAGGTGSLNDTFFAEGGHYSNINATMRNLDVGELGLTDVYRSIGGMPGDVDTTPPNAPTVKFIEDADNDGYINGSEFTSNLTKVEITVDGSVNVGDRLNSR